MRELEKKLDKIEERIKRIEETIDRIRRKHIVIWEGRGLR